MDRDALPFPLAAGYTTLALNGAKGGEDGEDGE